MTRTYISLKMPNILRVKYGNPVRINTGRKMPLMRTINSDPYVVYDTSEITQWLEANVGENNTDWVCGGNMLDTLILLYYIKDEKKRLLFKLVFGGYME